MSSGADGVVLLHGQPGAAQDWDAVRRSLDARMPTIAFDRPGWDGQTQARGIAENAETALAQMRSSGLGRAVIVGHSLGAAVAAWLAADHPERIAGLVLVAPSANVASLYRLDYWLASSPGGYVAIAAATFGLAAATQARAIRRLIARRFAIEERRLVQASERLSRRHAWRSFLAEQRALVHELPVLESRLASISVPTKILIGAKDRIVRRGSARLLASQIPGSSLHVVRRGGHLLPQSHPGQIASAIAQLL